MKARWFSPKIHRLPEGEIVDVIGDEPNNHVRVRSTDTDGTFDYVVPRSEIYSADQSSPLVSVGFTRPQLAAIQMAITAFMGMSDADMKAAALDYGVFRDMPAEWEAIDIKSALANIFVDLAPGH